MTIRRSLVFVGLLMSVHLSASELTSAEQQVLKFIDQRREAAVDLLARCVNIPSATENHEGVKRVGELYAAELASLGFETTWVDQKEVGRAGHLVAEHRGTKGTRVLLIGHLDTVLQGEAFRRDGRRGYGSGSSDMKSGNVIIVEALRALHAAGRLTDRQVIVVLTGDEEDTGRPYESSRSALVEAAKRSDVALAFEGYEPGTAVVGRRGFSSWRLEVAGSQGHSSTIFGDDRGSGAIFEAARILQAFHAELREPYLTYNPSVVIGGTEVKYDSATFTGTATGKTNVVPRSVIVEGDMRFLSREQLERARGKMRAIVAANLPKTSASITFEDGMPSMEPTDGNRALLATLDQVSRDLGTGPITAHDPSKRGAGDISFVATLLSGLDGLGGLGAQEHAPGEYTDLEEMAAITKRAALLLNRVLWAPRPAMRQER
ncbi:MAG: M20/M25/M40 family metallo-hydrolase [Acidobacteria bacterium]|nr:M20/M25/M40 family metallo-hydrolase [Acidobacteriota bacterium]